MPFVHLSWLLIKEPSGSVSKKICRGVDKALISVLLSNLILSCIRQHFLEYLFQIFLKWNFGGSHPAVLLYIGVQVPKQSKSISFVREFHDITNKTVFITFAFCLLILSWAIVCRQDSS